MPPRCVIVLPAYNEAENLAAVCESIFEQAPKIQEYELWVLVVEDHSPDGTWEVLQSLLPRYPRLRGIRGQKNGLGEAYKRGFKHARELMAADLLMQMDADLQHDARELPSLIGGCANGSDVVIGSRFAPGGSTPNFGWHRRLISRTGGWAIHHWVGLPKINDYTSGYRCFRASLLPQIQLDGLTTRGYSFMSSLLAEFLRVGAVVTEHPIVFGQRQHGESKLSARDLAEFGLNLGRLRRRYRTHFKNAGARADKAKAAHQGGRP